MEYVYLIQCEATGNTKIGRSKNPEERIKSLQTSNAGKLRIISKIVCNDGDAHLLEQRLHKEYKDKRLHGEWFKLTRDDIEIISKKKFISMRTWGNVFDMLKSIAWNFR
jgi:predicted GIY-YIG superfamily endonuclease